MANFSVEETDLVYRQAVKREGKPCEGQVKVGTESKGIKESNRMTMTRVTSLVLACPEPLKKMLMLP